MDTFTVSFFGHRVLYESMTIEKKLEEIICDILRKENFAEFLVGRDGEFDCLVSSVVLRCKQAVRNDNSALVWVMPYETADYRKNKEAYHMYYDEIEICAYSHFRRAHQIRNMMMVDRSDAVIFCVDRASGGAYQTRCYAQRRGKFIVDLGKEK